MTEGSFRQYVCRGCIGWIGRGSLHMDSIVKMGVRQSLEDPQKSETVQNRTESAYGQVPRYAGGGMPQMSRETFSRTQAAPAAKSGGDRKGQVQPQVRAEKNAPVSGANAKSGKEKGGAATREEQRAMRRWYRMIAAYVVAAVVCSYVLIHLTDNLGAVLAVLGKTVTTIGLLLQPLFWGFILAYILQPAVKLCENRLRKVKALRKKRSSLHTTAVIITCIVVLLAVVILCSIIVSAVTRSLRVASLDDMVAMAQSLVANLQSLGQTIMIRLERMNISSEEVNSALKQLGEKAAQFTKGLGTGMAGSLGQIGGFLTNTLFGVIFAIYFLLDGKGLTRYWNRVLLAVGGRKVRKSFHVLAKDADAVFSGYIRGQLIDAVIMAILVSAALSLIGVPYAVIIGLLSGIGNLVPYVGPVVAYGSTILVCFLTGDLRRLLAAIVVLFIIQTLDGNVINPRLLSSSVDVHPMLVIASLIVGGAVGGLVGMLFAVPVGAFLKIQFDKIIDRLLEARMPEKRRKSPSRKKRSAAGNTKKGNSNAITKKTAK